MLLIGLTLTVLSCSNNRGLTLLNNEDIIYHEDGSVTFSKDAFERLIKRLTP